MIKINFLCLIAILSLCLSAKAQEITAAPQQSVPQPYAENYIHEKLDKMPEFPGGINKFREFVMNNFNFPEEVTESIRFAVSFVVERDGSLTNIKIMNDPGFGISDEMKRIFSHSAKWTPGYYDQKPVRTHFMFPVTLQFE